MTHARSLVSDAHRLFQNELVPSLVGIAAMAIVVLALKSFDLQDILGPTNIAGVGFGVFVGVGEIVRERAGGGVVRLVVASALKGVGGGMLFAWLVSL